MTFEEFYTSMGVDYQRVLSRLQDESRVKRYLGLFLRDPQMGLLTNAMQEKRWKEAFEAAHTLKGVSLNLDIKAVADACIPLVEALRTPDGYDKSEPLFNELQVQYKRVMDMLAQCAVE